MPNYQTIRMKKKHSIGYLTLNRPQVRNAFNREMIDELQQVLTLIDKDNEIRVLIITARQSRNQTVSWVGIN